MPLNLQETRGEILPLVDKNDQLSGYISHKELYGKKANRANLSGAIVRTAAIAMVRTSTETGELELLIQRRHKEKKRWANRYDILSEHVEYSRAKGQVETYKETALRGAMEEYQLQPHLLNFSYHYRNLYTSIPEIAPISKMVTVFVSYFDNIESINCSNGDEVADVSFKSKTELQRLLLHDPESLTLLFIFFWRTICLVFYLKII